MREPGFYRDIPEAEYHASEGVSKSQLWVLHTKSPAHMRFGEKAESPAVALGSLIHAATLTPEALGDYAIAPAINKNTNDYKAWKAATLGAGKIICDQDDMDRAQQIADRLRADRTIAPLLMHKSFMPEVSGYWQDESTGEACRCRWDGVVPHRALLDLKSTADASTLDDLTRSILKYGYHVQEASYRHAWNVLTGQRLPFIFIFVEKVRPFAHRVVEIDYEFNEIGWKLYRRALETYHQCRLTDTWPAYPTGVIDSLGCPDWYRRAVEGSYSRDVAA